MNDVDIKALPDDVATLKALILNQATELICKNNSISPCIGALVKALRRTPVNMNCSMNQSKSLKKKLMLSTTVKRLKPSLYPHINVKPGAARHYLNTCPVLKSSMILMKQIRSAIPMVMHYTRLVKISPNSWRSSPQRSG